MWKVKAEKTIFRSISLKCIFYSILAYQITVFSAVHLNSLILQKISSFIFKSEDIYYVAPIDWGVLQDWLDISENII